ncbi:MAG TPA: hypothetical protein DHV86_01920, partial [Methylophilaceae bacterium]|nr:hypothetical protein [Methylophilaceae bacterium]
MQKDGQNNIYSIQKDFVSPSILSNKNRARSWVYGYDDKYDIVVISKNGQVGEIVNISGLNIGLPPVPEKVYKRSDKKSEQYWQREDLPRELAKIQSIFHWNEMPSQFKDRLVDYIENEFDYRERGFWFMNNGKPTYITGSHYMYLQWASIDVGYPDFREANRIYWIYWEACRADNRSFGMIYLKIRRSGFSFMASSECINVGTLARDARVGILSKTGADAKKMFTDKVVPINSRLPFFFKPIMDGMDKPKTELSFRIPASKITKKNMYNSEEDTIEGLDTSIDWKNTEDNSYDGEKLLFLAHDESGKWLRPNNIKENWRVTKTCLRLGSKIIGKCMMGSTSNALSKGGSNFKDIYEDSSVLHRNANGQTKSGLYSLFIPMEWNMEG